VIRQAHTTRPDNRQMITLGHY